MIHRRSFITGLVSLVAAPAIVRAGSLMPVRVMVEPITEMRFTSYGRGPAMNALSDMWAQHWEDVARAVLSEENYRVWKGYR